jgi:biopolymer transport protein ExbD
VLDRIAQQAVSIVQQQDDRLAADDDEVCPRIAVEVPTGERDTRTRAVGPGGIQDRGCALTVQSARETPLGAKLGGPSGGKATVDTRADMNVTPLVDVMLVLLIIFMVAAPLATVSIRLDLPPATPPPPNVKPEEPTFVSLQQSGALYIGSTETGLVSLAADLTRIIAKPNPTEERVFVRADGDVRYVDFMAVMNALQDGGFYKVALVGENLQSNL